MEIKFIGFARIHFYRELKSRLTSTHKCIHPSFGKLNCFYHLTMRFSRSFCSNNILFSTLTFYIYGCRHVVEQIQIDNLPLIFLVFKFY